MGGGGGVRGEAFLRRPPPFSPVASGSEQIYKADENVFPPPRILSFLGLLEKTECPVQQI
jgi:hypothetical protein